MTRHDSLIFLVLLGIYFICMLSKGKIKNLEKILKALFGWITLCFFLNKRRSRLFFLKDFLEKKKLIF